MLKNSNNTFPRVPLTASLALGFCLLPSAVMFAHGQAASSANALEEVIVTASKREQSLQDVSVSVSTLSAEDITRNELRDSEELLLRVPNLDIRTNSGSSNANIFIRGVGTLGAGFNLQAGVGVYFDEVALNSQVVNILQTYDLERVEVLRGPQNTLYGRNTTGGAINFISKKPRVGGETEGYASATYGRFNELDFEGAVGGPIGDSAAYRVAVQSQNRDGIRENQVTGNQDVERDKLAGRVQLAFEPMENLAINLKAHAERIDNDNLRYKAMGAYQPDVDSPDPSRLCDPPFQFGCNTGYGFVDNSSEKEFSSDMVRPLNTVDAMGGSMNVDMDFENFVLTSITAYEENEQDLSADLDGTPRHDFHFFIESEQEQWSQELRLTSLGDSDFRWLVGAYGFWEKNRGTTGPTLSTPRGLLVNRSDARFENTSYSGYFNVEYDVTERVTLKGGFRAGQDNVQGSTTALNAFESQLPGLDVSGPTFSGDMLPDYDLLFSTAEANGARIARVGGPTDPDAKINDFDFEEWGGELGVEFRPSENQLAYGKWSRGYKAGLFPNAPMSIFTGLGDVPIEPEIVNNYEVGFKSEFADGRARLNVAAFFIDYQNQQQNQAIEGRFEVVSIDSEIYGGELEFSWLPMEGLFFSTALSLLEGEVTEAVDPGQVGNSLVAAPDFTGNMSLRKEWYLNSGALFSIGADARYSSRRYFNLENSVSDDGYAVFNAQAIYEFGEGGKHKLSLWGKNLLNEKYVQNGFIWDDNSDGQADYHSVTLGMPLTYGVSVRTSF
jgi:iron complex outermembrane receptor protein